MDGTRFIYLQTVQHTGSWFMLAFLSSHPDVGGVIVEPNVLQSITGAFSRINKGNGSSDPDVPEGFVLGKVNILFSHIASHSFADPDPYICPRQMMTPLASDHPLVVPLRDPLLAMITHKRRIPDFVNFRLEHKKRTWMLYFRFLTGVAPHKAIIWVPIDILESHNERCEKLVQVLAGYGLAVTEEDRARCMDWAKKWPICRSKVASSDPAKVAYYARDLDWFEANMSHELAALREIQGDLRPLLEVAGYSNLLWWG